MRECQHCHTEVQFVIWIVDTGEQDFDPAEKGLIEAGQYGRYWCLDCVRGIKQDPDERNALDFSGLLSGDITKPLK